MVMVKVLGFGLGE